MKVICVMVQSVNGKITHADNAKIYKWTSKEDKAHFESLVNHHKLIVMGRETYEAAKKVIKPVEGKLRIVLTREPEKYADVTIAGQLEFRNQSPADLVSELDGSFTELLLCGGAQINTLFLKAGLFHELYLTLEPQLFGQGKGILAESDIACSLRLLQTRQLNEKGTLLLHYEVN